MSAPSVSDAPAPALASGLRLAVVRLARRLRAERSETDLTLTQLSVLAVLDRHGPLSPGELAAHERVKAPSMTRAVASLEADGYVTRTPHATDGRQVVVRLADAGAALLGEDRRRRDVWLAQRLAALPDEDVAALLAAVPVLDRLAAQ